MPSVPTNVFELLMLLLLVLPGTVYQFVRTRLRGPSPDDAGALSRVLRALGVSALLVTLYALLVGPQVLGLIADAQADNPDDALDAVRPLAAWALALLVAVPAALAVVDHARRRHTLKLKVLFSSYDPTPRAWDAAFIDREPCYVRALTTEGRYLGGWYGPDSFVSSFPEPREMYLETAHLMNPDGSFGDEVTDSAGLYIRCDDVRLVELVAPTQEEPHHEEPSPQEELDGGTITDWLERTSIRWLQRAWAGVRALAKWRRRAWARLSRGRRSNVAGQASAAARTRSRQ